MQLLNVIATLALTGTLAAAAPRNCPVESDCFQKSCKAITINERIKLGGTWPDVDPTKAVLEAECKDDNGKEWLTWLNLKECIANFGGNMEWGNQLSLPPSFLPLFLTFLLIHSPCHSGGFACQLCKIKDDRKSDNDPVVMECHCFNDAEKLVKSEINLCMCPPTPSIFSPNDFLPARLPSLPILYPKCDFH